jgi:hypothetical protein
MTKYWVVPASETRMHAWAIMALESGGTERVVSYHRSERKAKRVIDTLLAMKVAQDMAQWRDILKSQRRVGSSAPHLRD